MNSIHSKLHPFVLAAIGCFLFCHPNHGVWSQIVLSPDYPHVCHMTNMEAFIALKGGKQTLVLEAKYAFETKKDVYGRPLVPESDDSVLDPPKKLAWIVPVPPDSQPAAIETGSLMGDLFDLTHPSTKAKYHLRTGRPQGITRFGGSIFTGGVSDEEEPLKWSWIEPSSDAVQKLRDLLTREGLAFPESSPVQDYVEKGWKIGVGILEEPGIAGVLGPFAVEFSSETAVLPLRFQSQAGEFSLSVYVLSDKILDHRAISQWDMRGINPWENLHREAWFRGYVSVADMEIPESVKPIVEAMAGGSLENLSFYAWEGKDYNGYGRTTERFKQDFSIPAK
ncbi:MAG: DUF2330 domain-containing protein [Candidatus Omnitrophica bacterium]|nr:DUF2330 domain-containing protein [Candidatus Omnitrophota bacterium]MCA9416871.1 DUF2330 domain-containing protein [Candidatus Omnitrophota bacterium]MCA9441036.1 DUF2330 domain-containing protein [Candidatus Omnitrophota bacterium]